LILIWKPSTAFNTRTFQLHDIGGSYGFIHRATQPLAARYQANSSPVDCGLLHWPPTLAWLVALGTAHCLIRVRPLVEISMASCAARFGKHGNHPRALPHFRVGGIGVLSRSCLRSLHRAFG
jgi:hypothetical protein